MGHFVPTGREGMDLRTKEARPFSRTHLNRWRYGEDGEPERYQEKLPKREILPHMKTGYFGADLSSPMWTWDYGAYGSALDDSKALLEGVELTQHHEGMHSAMNDELMDHFSQQGNELLARRTIDNAEYGDGTKKDDDIYQEVQDEINSRFHQAHEYGAHTGEEAGLENPNTLIGRRQQRIDSPTTDSPIHRKHIHPWGKYLHHTGSRMTPEALKNAEEVVMARHSGIPFPPSANDFDEDWVTTKPDSRGAGVNMDVGPLGDDYRERESEHWGEWGNAKAMSPAEEAFRSYLMSSPELNHRMADDVKDQMDTLASRIHGIGRWENYEPSIGEESMRAAGMIPQMKTIPINQGEWEEDVPDPRRAMGLRALANAAKLGGHAGGDVHDV